jgi:transposase
MSKVRFLGLDVHADTISVATAELGGDVSFYGKIPNQLDAVRRMVKKLGAGYELRACYEAGPTGYVLYWQLSLLGVKCEVIAPSLIPTKAGDKVKTDHRDALKLARHYRNGELTPVWVPDAAHEALRDLVRTREDARADQQRARQRLGKFLLRHGQRPEGKMANWSLKHMEWIKRKVHFEQPALEATLQDYVREVEHAAERIHRLEEAITAAVQTTAPMLRAVVEALQAMRGVALISAVSIVAELGMLSRFDKPRQLMGYSGLVPSEDSSGNRIQRGAITKTGNSHLRRVIVEASWAYQFRPWVGGYLAKRQKGLDAEVIEIAWKAQHRLHARYKKLLAAGKKKPQIVTAVGRELLGFIWAIAVKVEAKFQAPQRAAA